MVQNESVFFNPKILAKLEAFLGNFSSGTNAEMMESIIQDES